MRVFRCLLIFAFTLIPTSLSGADLTIHPTGGITPIKVAIQMVLIDLETIDGAQQNYTANLAYLARWNDPRLKHDGATEKTVSLEDIWHPRLQFVNRQNLQSTFPDEARVSPDGGVVTVQRVWGQFSQPLVLHDFPFDRQTLTADIAAAGHQEDTVVLTADAEFPSNIADRLAISDWKVASWNAEPVSLSLAKDGTPLPAFRLSVTVERNYRYHLVNFILPLILIIGMSWVVFWINPKNANPRFSISVTAMLTLIAYRFAISSGLPKIGYLTRMDWFILGSSVLVFTSLLEVVVTSWLAENDRPDAASRLNKRMRFIAPTTFVIIAVLSLGG